MLSGGPTNPFSIAYFLNVVLAAVMLDAFWTWVMALASSLAFGATFFFYRPIPEWEHHFHHHGFSLHLHGMWLSYLIVSLLAAYFLVKIVKQSKLKELRLKQFEELAINQKRLALLAALAGGAAHELGTPLANIVLIASELSRQARDLNFNQDVISDLDTLKTESFRCKEIIQKFSQGIGEPANQTLESVAPETILRSVVKELESENLVSIKSDAEVLFKNVPSIALRNAFKSIIKNALEAGADLGAAPPVLIEIRQVDDLLRIDIIDKGKGIKEGDLDRVGEPFFSTKQNGEGMGLGVYLARLTAEQLGGQLSYRSKVGEGTTATFMLPIDVVNKKQLYGT